MGNLEVISVCLNNRIKCLLRRNHWWSEWYWGGGFFFFSLSSSCFSGHSNVWSDAKSKRWLGWSWVCCSFQCYKKAHVNGDFTLKLIHFGWPWHMLIRNWITITLPSISIYICLLSTKLCWNLGQVAWVLGEMAYMKGIYNFYLFAPSFWKFICLFFTFSNISLCIRNLLL